jgi:hypothetical protein
MSRAVASVFGCSRAMRPAAVVLTPFIPDDGGDDVLLGSRQAAGEKAGVV